MLHLLIRFLSTRQIYYPPKKGVMVKLIVRIHAHYNWYCGKYTMFSFIRTDAKIKKLIEESTDIFQSVHWSLE